MVFTTGYPMRQVHSQPTRETSEAENAAWKESLIGKKAYHQQDYLGIVIGVNTTSVRLDTECSINIGALLEYTFVPVGENPRGER